MNEPRYSEEELIRRSQQGDEVAFRLIVEKYKSALFGTAYLIVRDHQIAEEAVQETILKMWKHLPSLRVSSSIKPWLLRIVVNEAKQLLRKKRVSTVPLEQASELPDDCDADQILTNNENHRLLRRAITSLSPGQREVVVLRYFTELSVPEIAMAISTREGTVKSRLSRALDRLEEIMEGGNEFEKGRKSS